MAPPPSNHQKSTPQPPPSPNCHQRPSNYHHSEWLHRTRSFNGKKGEEVVKIGGDSSLHSLQRPSVNNHVVGGGGGGGGSEIWFGVDDFDDVGFWNLVVRD
ncbi:hypothetical protein Q3G72_015520 [Acer saccharum]|nr:hypothetical protein Q3G72_015520 [Acer saccharum]